MENEKLQLNIRHIAQSVRRNMITRVKPTGQTYKRNKKVHLQQD